MTNDEIARQILDTASYVVLATSDADGLPWARPAVRDFCVMGCV